MDRDWQPQRSIWLLHSLLTGFWAWALWFAYVCWTRDEPIPRALAIALVLGLACFAAAMTAWTVRRARRVYGRLRDLERMEKRWSEHLPQAARDLLADHPRTFYFIDDNAVRELHVQIHGKLQPSELRQTRKRASRLSGGVGCTPASIAGGLKSSVEEETRSVAVTVLATEVNQILQHMIENDEVRFGLDEARQLPSSAAGESVISAPQRWHSLAPTLGTMLEREARRPDGGIDHDKMNAIANDLLERLRLAELTDELEEAAEAKKHVYLCGTYCFRRRGDYVELTQAHPSVCDASEVTQKPRFFMRIACSAPPLTPLGFDAFTARPSGTANLRCLAMPFSWDNETRTLHLSPIAIF